MSDETRDSVFRARTLAVKAVSEYADAYEHTAGGIVTAYVLVAEVATTNGHQMLWLTGSGAEPTQEHAEGLTSWRLDGMLRYVIDRERCGYMVRTEEDEEES